MQELKIRNSNHEMLRLISMYMIIFIHANMHLRKFVNAESFEVYKSIVNGICNTGVTLFILISGFYGIRFTIKKLVKMECLMISLSLIEFFVIYALMGNSMSASELIEQFVKSVIPFVSRKYWFYSSYICLFIFSPYINKLIEILPQMAYKKMLICLLTIFSVFPTVFYFEIMQDAGKGVIQMLMIYLIGRYLGRYVDLKKLYNMRKTTIVLLLFAIWTINGLSHAFPISYGNIYHHLTKDNSITNIILACCIFILFSNMNFYSKLVNNLSKDLFAAFALEFNFINIFIHYYGGTISENLRNKNGILGFGCMMLFVFGVMIACILLGRIRNMALNWLDNIIADKVEKIIYDFENKK